MVIDMENLIKHKKEFEEINNHIFKINRVKIYNQKQYKIKEKFYLKILKTF